MHLNRFALDEWIEEDFTQIKGLAIGLVCNQASIASDCTHILDRLLPFHRDGDLRIQAVFGPQHGVWGHTQDNMVEWEGYEDPRTRLMFHSLYGKHREPTDEMLSGIEHLVVDLPDVGTRIYTFIWTMALCMKACEAKGIPLTVLDRPNPISGAAADGPVMETRYASFVGLHPLPARHGMTMGEMARYFQSNFYPKLRLSVRRTPGWHRTDYFGDTGLPWAMPSPNMPTLDTALVYPGMCLLEGTNLSEGRGTTRPFEMFGAPFVDGWALCERLGRLHLPGVRFRPIQLRPTFNKYAGEICQGASIHVCDRHRFRPVLTGLAILQELVALCGDKFAWLQPPYEYEAEQMPIDILAGNRWVRAAVEQAAPLDEIAERLDFEVHRFAVTRGEALMY
jgi:uncharacterized protein YbbC (DUF1343 family)